ncbi:hypothetical protein [Mycobacterium asiaticum]|uniref:hypothetical protein n=1 Tax=Mycobacterium asiaticum TaxID=1790 RepID=UPI000AACB7BA|nr:hypothetical protein [Mycobacterium asiaticum]
MPDVVPRAAYKLYGDSTAVTELKQYADRGHSLVVDNGLARDCRRRAGMARGAAHQVSE